MSGRGGTCKPDTRIRITDTDQNSAEVTAQISPTDMPESSPHYPDKQLHIGVLKWSDAL
ncbi:MAG: hypothetical protein P1U90_11325 [Akkermansiaceae bacterium]|nr:hypothetical protein [Akkermansiaceae bacterium]